MVQVGMSHRTERAGIDLYRPVALRCQELRRDGLSCGAE